MRPYGILNALLAGAGLLLANMAHAGLTLTADGIAKGFTLTTFLSGYHFGNYGPLAQGVLPGGDIITGSAGDGKIYIFDDVDNQKLGDALSATPYSDQTGNPNYAMATAGGQVYGAQLGGGVFERFDSTGAHSALTGEIASLRNYLGMWGNPVNGHVIAMSQSGPKRGLIDIDPLSGNVRVVNAGVLGDGVTVSPDGRTAYVEHSGGIAAYDLNTGALIRFFHTGHSPDGTGVIAGGALSGAIVVNDNDGTVGLLDPTKSDGDAGLFQIIASGGSRGDFVSPDLNNGTLFLSQTDSVMRLACGPNCFIGSVPTPPQGVPEPAAWVLLGIVLAAIAYARRRKVRR